MKLLILSDSHGEQEFMQLAVRRERPDAVIHLGDHCADADRLAEEFCGLPVLSVRGNCDLWGPPRAETLLRTFEGVRIFGTHGHRYGVKQGLLRFSLAAQEQQAASRKQEKFNRTMKVLGFLGDVVQLAITGTTGLGTLAGNLANSRYNRAASERAYADSRADTAWEQRMKELQRQDSLTQQQYKNELAEREYQDTLRQQQFSNDLASEKLDIAKGEWALKQSKAAQSARQASTNASAKAESGLSGSGLTAGKSGVSSGTLVPYSAARLRSQGRSDSAIRNELLKEGYSSEEVKSIMKQMNS